MELGRAYLRLFGLGLSRFEWRLSNDEARDVLISFARLDIGFRNGIRLHAGTELGSAFESFTQDAWSHYTYLRVKSDYDPKTAPYRKELGALLDRLELGPAHSAEVLTILACDDPDLRRRLEALQRALRVDPACLAARWHCLEARAELGEHAAAYEDLLSVYKTFRDRKLCSDVYAIGQENDLVGMQVVLLAELDRREEAKAALTRYQEFFPNPGVVPERGLLQRFPWLAEEQHPR